MKVLFAPFAKAQPYQKLLAESLIKLGVRVVFANQLTPFMPFFLLISIVKNWKPDILHLHWTHSFFISRSKALTVLRLIIFIADLLVVKLLGVKIVWTVHNKYNHERMHISLDIFASTVIARICDVIKVGCRYARSEIIRLYRINEPSKVKVILNGTDGNYINLYANILNKEDARKRLGLGDNHFLFLYIGLIRPYKGVTELIDAFSQLDDPLARLIIVGKPLDNQIKSEIHRKCIRNPKINAILKFVPDEDIEVYMNAADIVVLPFRDIFTSSSVVLAMSFAKPVISPAIGCIPEVLGKHQVKLLYNPIERDALFNAMREAINKKSILQRIGETNYRRIVKKLNWNRIANETLAIYRSCVCK